MTDKTKEPAGTTQAAADQAAISKAASDAKIAERARVNGILGCEEAKGRTELANHIAMNTDMSVDEAKAMLKVAPAQAAATPAAAANPFAAAMNNSENPNVTTEASGGGGEQLSAAEQILQSQSKATGLKLVTK